MQLNLCFNNVKANNTLACTKILILFFILRKETFLLRKKN